MKSKLILSIISTAWLMGFNSCNRSQTLITEKSSDSKMKENMLIKDSFDRTIDGKKTGLFTLSNGNGMQASITSYGGRLVSLLVPDRDGNLRDVVVGLPGVDEYAASTEPYFGATIGRFGNRIAKGKFSLEGKTYTLFTNNGVNSLHGGKKGFQAVVWDARQIDDHTLELSYLSKDMEEGYPGNLQVKVLFTLTDNNELKIGYRAVTDQTTVLNLTNHAFFNLNGEGSGTILNHLVEINAQKYTPVDSTLIPLGHHEPVEGTPFDFRKPTTIGSRINDNHIQLKYGKGYDHNFVLDGKETGLKHAARAQGDQSGIIMDVFTAEPGLQFYSGNFMAGENKFKGGSRDEFRTAFCMETQHFPDSPNQPAFPSTILKPGATYETTTVYKFAAN